MNDNKYEMLNENNGAARFIYRPPNPDAAPLAVNVNVGHRFLTRTEWWNERPKNFALLDPATRARYKRFRRRRARRGGVSDAIITNDMWIINLRKGFFPKRKFNASKIKKGLRR